MNIKLCYKFNYVEDNLKEDASEEEKEKFYMNMKEHYERLIVLTNQVNAEYGIEETKVSKPVVEKKEEKMISKKQYNTLKTLGYADYMLKDMTSKQAWKLINQLIGNINDVE